MNKISVRNRNKGTGRKPNWEYRFEGAKINGKRHQISKSGFPTKKEAYQEGIKQLNHYSQNKQTIIETNISFNDFFLKWLNSHINALSLNTQRHYRQYADNHILPFLGSFKLSNINSQVINELLLECQKKGLSAKYIATIFSILNMALQDAYSIYHYLPTNPCTAIRKPQSFSIPKHRKPISTEQWQIIMEHFPFGTDYHVLLCLGYYCGLRISEATAITWNDVDFTNNTITVNKQLLYQNRSNKNAWYFCKTKTSQSVRKIIIPDILRNTLIKEKERQMQNEIDYGKDYYISILDGDAVIKTKKPADSRVFFVTLMKNGRNINNTNFKNVTKIIKPIIPDFDFHTLRHTHATMLMESGASIKAIQSRLGHSSVNMTLQVYSHDTEYLDRSTVENYSAFLKNGGQIVGK